MKACVYGAGSFGTAVATVLASNCETVALYGRDAAAIDALNATHENAGYLPGLKLPERVRGTTSIEEAARGADLVVVATPSHATRELIGRALPYLPRSVPIITVAKGIENDTLLTMTEVLEQALPEELHPYVGVLSGPSFAKEMVLRLPTIVTIAARWEKLAQRAQKIFSNDTFRTYTSTDVVGVQVGGSLKNVIAIAAGMADGLGFGHNARAGIITRGLAEITRVAVRMGANPLTLSGLAGMGDLVLTCTGELSRNRRVGLALGQGKKLDDVLAEMKQVAEGVKTARAARDLSKKMGVELPICEQVYLIAYEGKNPKQAVMDLMTRTPKAEAL
ncbi:MAG: NAD(P)-dependent glycerol-3-phosphate dehydrogenase [Archangiaceae bacterium]|nr:NAD(P)-dependent glycerol-3-phosphate dehydrogenase [Archangiaceae bacterium]